MTSSPADNRVGPTLEFEHTLGRAGHRYVIACDEVGRGALAGPVAVGMVVIDTACTDFPDGLRDSKLLSAHRREALVDPCRRWSLAWAVGMAQAAEIDAEGIMAGLGLAGRRALTQLGGFDADPADCPIVLDGTVDYLTALLPSARRVITRAKADRDCASVAAASVLAKVRRDRLMVAEHDRHPHYQWAQNKGYGSQRHRSAITEHGASPLHRLTWISKYLSAAQMHVDLPR